MKKHNLVKIIGIALYVPAVLALTLFLAYKGWMIATFVTIFFLPLLILFVTKKSALRTVGLFAFWALLIVGFVYINSMFARIIIVNGETTYTVEKVRKGVPYKYIDSNGQEVSIPIERLSVDNRLDMPLRLYEVSYSKYQTKFGGPGTNDVMEIPPHSVTELPKYPDYILEYPPTSIVVRKRGIRGVLENDKVTTKLFLDVKY